MAQSDNFNAGRTLVHAVLPDLLIAVLFGLACYSLQTWYGSTGSISSLIAGWTSSFLVGFMFIYLCHERGHYLDARLAGADVPLGSGKGVFVGIIRSRRLYPPSVHGDGYWRRGRPPDSGTAFYRALSEFGFYAGTRCSGPCIYCSSSIRQYSRAIANPHHGADAQATLDAGTASSVILRKTTPTWGYWF